MFHGCSDVRKTPYEGHRALLQSSGKGAGGVGQDKVGGLRIQLALHMRNRLYTAYPPRQLSQQIGTTHILERDCVGAGPGQVWLRA